MKTEVQKLSVSNILGLERLWRDANFITVSSEKARKVEKHRHVHGTLSTQTLLFVQQKTHSVNSFISLC